MHDGPRGDCNSARTLGGGNFARLTRWSGRMKSGCAGRGRCVASCFLEDRRSGSKSQTAHANDESGEAPLAQTRQEQRTHVTHQVAHCDAPSCRAGSERPASQPTLDIYFLLLTTRPQQSFAHLSGFEQAIRSPLQAEETCIRRALSRVRRPPSTGEAMTHAPTISAKGNTGIATAWICLGANCITNPGERC